MVLNKITDKKGKCNVSTFAKPGREVFDDIHDIVGDAIGENSNPLDVSHSRLKTGSMPQGQRSRLNSSNRSTISKNIK